MIFHIGNPNSGHAALSILAGHAALSIIAGTCRVGDTLDTCRPRGTFDTCRIRGTLDTRKIRCTLRINPEIEQGEAYRVRGDAARVARTAFWGGAYSPRKI